MGFSTKEELFATYDKQLDYLVFDANVCARIFPKYNAVHIYYICNDRLVMSYNLPREIYSMLKKKPYLEMVETLHKTYLTRIDPDFNDKNWLN